MVTLTDVIKHLRPNASPLVDFAVASEKGVESIVFWSESLGDRPSSQDIDDATPVVERDILKRRIADLRWQKESQGITVGTQPVSTLREEMPVWQGMLLDIALRPGATSEFEYKPRGGQNVVLTVQQVQRIYECFAWYVAACFATERTLVSLIDGGAPIANIEAMLDSVWPQTVFTWERPE